ncbi:unnamed protein product, partial [Polarella glacialis]
IDFTDPITFEVLRQQNRQEPTKIIRKDLYRTTLWLKSKFSDPDIANTEYERLKRALDEEDSQCLVLSRSESDVLPVSALRTTKRNVQAVIDALDDLLLLLPGEEQQAAKAVADTKNIAVIRLPERGSQRVARSSSAAPVAGKSLISDDATAADAKPAEAKAPAAKADTAKKTADSKAADAPSAVATGAAGMEAVALLDR